MILLIWRSNDNTISGLLDQVYSSFENLSSLSIMDFISNFLGEKNSIAIATSVLSIPVFYNVMDFLSNDIVKLPKVVYRKGGGYEKSSLNIRSIILFLMN